MGLLVVSLCVWCFEFGVGVGCFFVLLLVMFALLVLGGVCFRWFALG